MLVEAAKAEAVKETSSWRLGVLPLPRHGEFYMVSPIADLMRNKYIDNVPTAYMNNILNFKSDPRRHITKKVDTIRARTTASKVDR
jgi:hypothetical protein